MNLKLYTVREAAKQPECPFSERHLRRLISKGHCPGVRIGNRFMIELETLDEWVRKEALKEVEDE